MLRFALEETGAAVDVQPGLPTIHGHAPLLGQLLANLVGNAIKYRRHDEPARIAVGWTTPGAEGVEITVADNGIGVPPEHRERVFGLFQRLHGHGAYPGTGVGLAICKRIVEEHGGTIRLDDTAGGGCTVRLTLCGARVEPRAEPVEQPSAPDGRQP
jgi:signal transduction histidine kinase